MLASAPLAPQSLTLDEVIETLSTFHDLPELLGTIEHADRAALYQALGLRVTYRRVGAVEQVRLRTSLRAVDLERVGVRGPEENSLVPALRSVDLERSCRRTDSKPSSTPPSRQIVAGQSELRSVA